MALWFGLKAEEQAPKKEKSEEYLMYQLIKSSIQNDRTLPEPEKSKLLQKIEEGNSKLQENIKLSRLDEFFDNFVSQNSQILLSHIKDENKYQSQCDIHVSFYP